VGALIVNTGGTKMKSINSVYKSIFGDYLTPLGFVNWKRTDFFLRLIGGNILQYVYLKKEYTRFKGWKEFTIYAGVRSIFSESMEKGHLLYSSSSLLYLAGSDYSIEQRRKLFSISYNEATIEEAVKHALEKTIEIIMPKLNSVTDLDSCIDYYKRYCSDMLGWAEDFSHDSLLLIKTDNHETFMKEFQESLDSDIKRLEKGEIGGDYNSTYKALYYGLITAIADSRDKVYNAPELYAKAIAELERREKANLETLRSYGLDV
jgi:hypothetical protein